MFHRMLAVIVAISFAGCGGPHGPSTVVEARDRPQTGAPAAVNTPASRSLPAVGTAAAELDTAQPLQARPPAAVKQPRPAEVFTIPAGTRIRVRLAQTLDTRSTRNGETFGATLDVPIVSGNRVAVPSGTPFRGVVLQSANSGRFKGRVVIRVALVSFTLDGQTYRIATAGDTRVSGRHRRRNIGLIGGGSAAGAAIGAFTGGTGALIGAGAGAAAGTATAFVTGKKHVTLPVETELAFRLRSTVEVGRGESR